MIAVYASMAKSGETRLPSQAHSHFPGPGSGVAQELLRYRSSKIILFTIPDY